MSDLDRTDACDCGNGHPENAVFYVSAKEDGRYALLAGPFKSHKFALQYVDPADRLAEKLNPWAGFWAFGTVAMKTTYATPGKLNPQLGL